MTDRAHKQTDNIIGATKRDLKKVFSVEYNKVKPELLNILAKMQTRSNMTASELLAEANKYNRLDTMATLLTDAVQAAAIQGTSTINKSMRGIYELNFNFMAERAAAVAQTPVPKLANKEAAEESKSNPFTLVSLNREKTKSVISSRIKMNIMAGVIGGATVGGIIQAVQNAFNESLNNQARTMATTATYMENKARQDVADYMTEKHQVYYVKKWHTQQDELVRDGHARADGQTVDGKHEFFVGGESLEYPGDMQGAPGNIINCRCSVVWVQHDPKTGEEVELWTVENAAPQRRK